MSECRATYHALTAHGPIGIRTHLHVVEPEAVPGFPIIVNPGDRFEIHVQAPKAILAAKIRQVATDGAEIEVSGRTWFVSPYVSGQDVLPSILSRPSVRCADWIVRREV